MIVPVISALILSMLIYLLIGLIQKKNIKGLEDIIPVTKNKIAQVKNSNEFSASTIATSISLATVIVAFFDLVPYLGVWLFWPVITTSFGFLLFSFLTKRIWSRMASYDHRPSLHEFLGSEFNSKNVALVGAIFTSLGYLSAFAVELTVGSRFIAGLIPGIPEWFIVIIVTIVGFTYTGLGGFRTVVITDRIQMWFIWILLFGLIGFYIFFSFQNGGILVSINRIPKNVRSLYWDKSLIAFIVGIFIMNLFTYVSNMSLWQRISGAQDPQTVVKGMRKSVYQSLMSWSLFVIVVVGAYIMIKPINGENILVTLLKFINFLPGGPFIVFIVTLGLLGALLSTASTQLIAVSHTIYEDIIAPFRTKNLTERIASKNELNYSRWILVLSALLAIMVVELLRIAGFSVADLAFSIYGAALGLVPPIIFSLFFSRDMLKKLSRWANISVTLGFITAWGVALYGKSVNIGNLVFLAPLFGIGVSGIILSIGLFLNRRETY